MKASRIPRPKHKAKMVKRSGKTAQKRSPTRCSLSPLKSLPLKTSTSSVTSLNTYRTEPNRTKAHKKSHARSYKSIVPQEISSILPCNDESVEVASPMLSSTRQSFVQSSQSTSEEKLKEKSQAVNPSLRDLLTKPPMYSVTSTPIVNTPSTSKRDSFLTITINSPSRQSGTSAASTPVRKRQPTATVTRETSVVVAPQTVDTQSAETEGAVDTSSQISGNYYHTIQATGIILLIIFVKSG